MATKPHLGLALEYVSDVAAAKRFYVEVLGLEVERDHPTFVQFREESGARFAIASDESMDGKDDLELYWLVDDAEATFEYLSRRAEVTMPLRQMPFGKVFGVRGPAGEPRYLLELSPNRPSQQVS